MLHHHLFRKRDAILKQVWETATFHYACSIWLVLLFNLAGKFDYQYWDFDNRFFNALKTKINRKSLFNGQQHYFIFYYLFVIICYFTVFYYGFVFFSFNLFLFIWGLFNDPGDSLFYLFSVSNWLFNVFIVFFFKCKLIK